MGFDYFYGRGTEQYAFYQVPKILITDDQFQDITSDCHKDHIQFITKAAVQLIAIYPVFTFTMFDHRFND